MKFPRLKSIFIDFEDIIIINFSGSDKHLYFLFHYHTLHTSVFFLPDTEDIE